MNNLFENWQKYINEDKEGKISPEQAIADEGGALGFSKWEELTGMSREEFRKTLSTSELKNQNKLRDGTKSNSPMGACK